MEIITPDMVINTKAHVVILNDYLGVNNAVVSEHDSRSKAESRARKLRVRARNSDSSVTFRHASLKDGRHVVVANPSW